MILSKLNPAAAVLASTWLSACVLDYKVGDSPQAKADVEVYLASSKTAASLCGTDAEAAYSCVKGNTVVINAQQWKTPAPGYGGDLARYRTFLVNHAFGHLIGRAHAKCSGKGKAPVMLQQGAGLGGCAVNPWP